MKQFNFLLFIIIFISLTSCVSSKKHKALQTSLIDTELRLQKANKVIEDLKSDTAFVGNAYRASQMKLKEQSQYADYTKSALVKKLKRQEKVLAERDFALIGKNKFLENQKKELESAQNTLKNKDLRLSSIKNHLFSHKVILDSMLRHLTSLLIEHETDGVNVYTRDGSLHLTMAEPVLFQPNSIRLKPSGQSILSKIAPALGRSNDVKITVVTHTDNKQKKIGLIQDNWDFGAIRAGSVIRVLEKNGVSAWNMNPSSQNEYYPIAGNETKEGRLQNRRIDIVVSPSWDKLFKMLEFQVF